MTDYLVDILNEILGDSRKHNETKGQIAYDCPACAEDKDLVGVTDGKGNLEINYLKGYYKCWACHIKNGTKGALYNLIKKYGNKDLLNRFDLVKTDYKYTNDGEDEQVIISTTKLPKHFLKLNEFNKGEKNYKAAMTYLKKRGIGQTIINKYNIGFVNRDELANRVIIPSYNVLGEVNYFIGRSFNDWVKPKYINSETPKENIIFNESLINPYATIYLVEGPFDSIVIPNCIPLLGLFLSDNLYWYLQTKAKANVVILLDGEARAETMDLYKKLNTLHLYNRVRVILLKEKYDTSLIYQKYGERGIKNILSKTIKLKEYN